MGAVMLPSAAAACQLCGPTGCLYRVYRAADGTVPYACAQCVAIYGALWVLEDIVHELASNLGGVGSYA